MSETNIHARLTRDVLDSQAIQNRVARPEAGAVTVFVGTTRNNHEGKSVQFLEYEAQESLALKTMEKICEEAVHTYGLAAAAIEHRLGKLAIGEASVIIAVSSAHRGPGFDGCRFLIDILKQRVPIWKKEHYANDDAPVWVGPDGKPVRV